MALPFISFFFISLEKLKPFEVNKMYGALDLGGGSVQITLPMDDKVNCF